MHEVVYPLIYWPVGIAVGQLAVLRDRETHVMVDRRMIDARRLTSFPLTLASDCFSLRCLC